MKTLYESILNSTGTGKSDFNFDKVTGYPVFTKLNDLFDILKVKHALKDEFMVPYDIKRAHDAKLITILLTQYTYTKPEIDLLKKEGDGIDKVFKEKIGEFLHKKNKDKFTFETYKGVDGWAVIIKVHDDPFDTRFIFYYDLNR